MSDTPKLYRSCVHGSLRRHAVDACSGPCLIPQEHDECSGAVEEATPADAVEAFGEEALFAAIADGRNVALPVVRVEDGGEGKDFVTVRCERRAWKVGEHVWMIKNREAEDA